MLLKAKFKGFCSLCRKPIQVGEVIEWETGEQARHRACAYPKNIWAGEIEEAVEALRVNKIARSRVVKEEKTYNESYIRKVFGKK